MKRRTWLLGSLAAGGALVVGWTALPPRGRQDAGPDLLEAPGDHALNGWVKVGSNDRVTVVLARAEMGQGVSTALPMLLCDEMDADFSRIEVSVAPVDGIYTNIATIVDGLPLHPDDQSWMADSMRRLSAKFAREAGLMVTGGSTSVKDLWLPMRQAGATARTMLIAAAAETWNVPVAECDAQKGTVRHLGSGRQLRFGALAALAARQSAPRSVPLKALEQRQLIGRPLPRLDAASKQTGFARFGIDQRLPEQLYATVLMSPVLGGRLARHDPARALAQPGVKGVVALPPMRGASAGVAVVADHPWRALKALKLVQAQWDDGPAAAWSDAEVSRSLEQALQGDDIGHAYLDRGAPAEAFARASQTVNAEYAVPMLAHATMEPQNCTVLFDPPARLALVWVGTQVPDLARAVIADVLELKPEQVHVHVPLIGGGFGRRLEVDIAAQAATIAKAHPGVPVQTFWSREQDTAHDFYRPPCRARWRAALNPEGKLVAVDARSAGPSVVQQYMARQFSLPALGPDKTTAEGAFDQPYDWPAARVAHRIVELPLPFGAWRSVGHSHQAFFVESFIDECAHAAKQDPLDYRLVMLSQQPRARAVLQRAAAMANWRQASAPAPDGAPTAWGLALHRSFGTLVAQAAQVSLDPADGKRIRVHQVMAVVDCGTVVNPNIARQQVEGGILFGLSAALNPPVRLERGQITTRNFDQLPLLRFTEAPRIQVDLVDSTAAPQGLGEPGTPPIAPAVANALFRLTGRRLRSLPLQMA